jgi:hypothetical protein
MPPSGFNPKAINGLLMYVKENYETVLADRNSSKMDEKEFLEQTVSELENKILTENNSPGTTGLKIFIVECYKDLVKEIYSGQDKYDRQVTNGQAIEKELSQIRNYLTEFKI